jgi:hypothetical protein
MKELFKILPLCTFYFLLFTSAEAQPLKPLKAFTHADTLRGTYGPTRDWWDVLKYDLHVKFNLEDSSISGYNIMQFKILKKAFHIVKVYLHYPLIQLIICDLMLICL